jgi:hypothetical protein
MSQHAKGAGGLLEVLAELVDCSVDMASSFVSIDLLQDPSAVGQAKVAHMLAIAHDGDGPTAAELRAGESGPVLAKLLRVLSEEVGVDACLLSRTARNGGARAAAFSAPSLHVHEWDSKGELVVDQTSAARPADNAEQPSHLQPFASAEQVREAIERIGSMGILLLLRDRAGVPVVGALDFGSDRTDLRLRTAGTRTLSYSCRALWRNSLRDRLGLLYGVTLPLTVSLRGERIAMRQGPLHKALTMNAMREQVLALRQLHGMLGPAGGVPDDESEDDGEESFEDLDEPAGSQEAVLATAHGVDLDSDDCSDESPKPHGQDHLLDAQTIEPPAPPAGVAHDASAAVGLDVTMGSVADARADEEDGEPPAKRPMHDEALTASCT